MKAMQIILICEECCRRLRETQQFLIMCHENSAMLQGYMAKIITASVSDADAALRTDLHHKQGDVNAAKCETKVGDAETVAEEPLIRETECEFVNAEDSFVKEEDCWKMEATDDKEHSATDNSSTESSDSETDTVSSANSNTHVTNPDGSGFKSTQVHTTNETEPNPGAKQSHKCVTCGKSFSTRSILQVHMRMHTGEKPYKCSDCSKSFGHLFALVAHTRTHTGEKPYKCTLCDKGFGQPTTLAVHTRTHTGEKPYECATCKKCFGQRNNLVTHMRVHSRTKPNK